jgi:hypothetical protein
MTCGEARPAIDAWADGELAREEERVLRAHLGACPACTRELGERRAFSGSLREAFDRGLEAAEPPPGARELLAGRLQAASRGRFTAPARLAAALVFGVAIGLGAWAVGMSRPTRLQAEVAAKIRDRRVNEAEVGRLTREIEQDVQKAVDSAPPAGLLEVIRQGARVIESRIAEPADKGLPQLVADTVSRDPRVRAAARSALRLLGPTRIDDLKRVVRESPEGDASFLEQVVEELEDRAQPVERGQVSISKTVNGATIAFTQLRDGRVRLAVPGRSIEEPSMAVLLGRHPELCRQVGLSGRDGAVTLDGTPAAVDLRGQLQLLFRTGSWSDEVQWDAYRAWMFSKKPDSKEVEARVKEMQARCRRALQDAPLPDGRPDLRIDVGPILKEVGEMTRHELEEAQRRVDQERRALEARLLDLRELRARAKGLRVYAEDLARDR